MKTICQWQGVGGLLLVLPLYQPSVCLYFVLSSPAILYPAFGYQSSYYGENTKCVNLWVCVFKLFCNNSGTKPKNEKKNYLHHFLLPPFVRWLALIKSTFIYRWLRELISQNKYFHRIAYISVSVYAFFCLKHHSVLFTPTYLY